MPLHNHACLSPGELSLRFKYEECVFRRPFVGFLKSETDNVAAFFRFIANRLVIVAGAWDPVAQENSR